MVALQHDLRDLRSENSDTACHAAMRLGGMETISPEIEDALVQAASGTNATLRAIAIESLQSHDVCLATRHPGLLLLLEDDHARDDADEELEEVLERSWAGEKMPSPNEF